MFPLRRCLFQFKLQDTVSLGKECEVKPNRVGTADIGNPSGYASELFIRNFKIKTENYNLCISQQSIESSKTGEAYSM